jgi:hypothetical protein
MNRTNPRTRILFSIAGVVFVTASMILNFTYGGTLWSWLLLGAALVMLLISRRYR